MDKRWEKIESIFHKVLEAADVRRSAVLEESCAGDESLKREVESLLAHHRNADDFIDRPTFEDVAPAPSPAKAQPGRLVLSLKGALVAHYRVLEEIGVGGMGVVYKAEDGDNHPAVLFSFTGLTLDEYATPVGAWSDVAPDASWMFIRDASTSDIYTLDLDFP